MDYETDDGWHENSNGNWLYIVDGNLEGTVFQTKDGTWSGVNNGEYFEDDFEDVDEAKAAYVEYFG